MKFKDVYKLLITTEPIEFLISDSNYSPIRVEHESLDEYALEDYGEYLVRFISHDSYGLQIGLKLIK